MFITREEWEETLFHYEMGFTPYEEIVKVLLERARHGLPVAAALHRLGQFRTRVDPNRPDHGSLVVTMTLRRDEPLRPLSEIIGEPGMAIVGHPVKHYQFAVSKDHLIQHLPLIIEQAFHQFGLQVLDKPVQRSYGQAGLDISPGPVDGLPY